MQILKLLENMFFHHPKKPTNLNLQLQLNLYLNRLVYRCWRRHPTPPNPNLWLLSPLGQDMCCSFPPVLYSDLILHNAACPALSCSVTLCDACFWSVTLCLALSHSAMSVTAPWHPCCSAPLCVANSRSVLLCAAPRYQNMSQ